MEFLCRSAENCFIYETEREQEHSPAGAQKNKNKQNLSLQIPCQPQSGPKVQLCSCLPILICAPNSDGPERGSGIGPPQLEFSCDGVRNLTSAEMKITSATEEPMAGGSPAEEVGRATAKVGMGCGRFLAESFVNRPWPRDFVLH